MEVHNPRVVILDIFSIIYKSNDPQIFHLQNKLWLYKFYMRLGACFYLGLFTCTPSPSNLFPRAFEQFLHTNTGSASRKLTCHWDFPFLACCPLMHTLDSWTSRTCSTCTWLLSADTSDTGGLLDQTKFWKSNNQKWRLRNMIFEGDHGQLR